MTDIESLLSSTSTHTSEKRASLKVTQDQLKIVRDIITYSGQNYANKKVYNEFRNARKMCIRDSLYHLLLLKNPYIQSNYQ